MKNSGSKGIAVVVFIGPSDPGISLLSAPTLFLVRVVPFMPGRDSAAMMFGLRTVMIAR